MTTTETSPTEFEIIRKVTKQLEDEARAHYENPDKPLTDLELRFGLYGKMPLTRAIGWKALLSEIDAQQYTKEPTHPDAYTSPEY